MTVISCFFWVLISAGSAQSDFMKTIGLTCNRNRFGGVSSWMDDHLGTSWCWSGDLSLGSRGREGRGRGARPWGGREGRGRERKREASGQTSRQSHFHVEYVKYVVKPVFLL